MTFLNNPRTIFWIIFNSPNTDRKMCKMVLTDEDVHLEKTHLFSGLKTVSLKFRDAVVRLGTIYAPSCYHLTLGLCY